MINITIDNLAAFHLTMAIVALGFALLIIFGRTEEEPLRKSRRTTTAS